MALVIKDAVKKNLRARIALLAPTGGGKTYTGLKFLFCLVKLGMARKVGVLDTEHGSASKYIGDFPAFRVIEMADDFSPEQYIEALQLLADDGCDAILIDSLTHAWAGKGGSLEIKDRVGRQKGFNDYTAWGPVTAMQNRLIESMLSYPGHLVATMRLKMEHVVEKDPITGKNVVRKIGLQPMQRDGLEYEFDLVGDLDQEHEFSVSKTRCSALDGYRVLKPGEEVIRKMKAWLETGVREEMPRPKASAKEEHPASVGVPAAKEALDQMAERVAPVIDKALNVLAAATPDAGATASTTPPNSTTTATLATAEPAQRQAQAFAAQMAAATSLDQLDAIALPIGAAHKAKALTDDERKSLIAIYLERRSMLSKPASNQAAA